MLDYSHDMCYTKINGGDKMICDKLKALREKKKLSRQQVADTLGISKRTLESYEYGQREPNIDMINKFADFYSVSADYLLGRTSNPDTLEIQLSNIDLRLNDEKFIELYSTLPDYIKQIIIEAMEKLVKVRSIEKRVNQRNAEEAPKKRHVERLGDIEDAMEQEEQAKSDDETSCA